MMQWTIDAKGETLGVLQTFVPPVVYLDQWALMKFAEVPNLEQRFISIINASGGTLAVSWANLFEFVGVNDKRHAADVERMLESILPQLYCIEFDTFKVIDRENQIIATGIPQPPHQAEDLLQAFAGMRPQGVASFTCQGIFSTVVENTSRLPDRLERLASVTLQRIEALREDFSRDKDFRRLVNNLLNDPAAKMGTRFLLREILRDFMLNKAKVLTIQDAFDLLHAVVPATYCDFVLLDRSWEVRVKQAQERLTKSKISSPMAKVFSSRNNGIERFFMELEAFQKVVS